MDTSASTLAASAMTGLISEQDTLQLFGDIITTARQFDLVRYIAVACLAVAAFDRILVTIQEIDKVWTHPRNSTGMSAGKILYFFNRYINLGCLGVDVYLFTHRPSMDSDCVWWFCFRAWASLVILTVIEAILVFRLHTLYDRWKPMVLGFTIFVIGQIVSNSVLTAKELSHVASVPSLGPWFNGCFPMFQGPVLWPSWITALSIQLLAAGMALIHTFQSHRRHPEFSLFSLLVDNGIFYVIGIADLELSPVNAKHDLEYATNDSQSEKPLNHTCVDLTPLSHQTTLFRSESKIPAVEVVKSVDETIPAEHQPVEAHALDPLPGPPLVHGSSLLYGPSSTGHNQSPGHRRSLSDSTFPPASTQVEDDEVDLALEDQYDENGRPRRTHQRRWKSDEFTHIPFEVDSSPHLASNIPTFTSLLPQPPPAAGYFGYTREGRSSSFSRIYSTVSRTPAPASPSSPLASSSTPPSPRRSFERPPSRGRISHFLHRHRNDVVVVPEEEVPNSFAYATPSPDSPTSPSNRRFGGFSPSSRAARVRRFLASSPPPSPLSVRTMGRSRSGESDAQTICSVSTGFAFDNSNAFDAPDFT
ncbi:hypothetical protein FRB99_001278 [Tulasnella sp. 403]|nr:hypothetical protein FRB99_001278 [Tulasnella sp. 403]